MNRLRRAWSALTGAETRSYTDAVTEALLATATGSETARAASTAAMEACAGLWGRTLSRAEVTPADGRGQVLTAATLYDMGRDLCLTGETVHLIRTGRGRLRLLRVETYDLDGGPDPETWRYRVTLPGPSLTETVTVAAGAVLHVRIGSDRSRPWAGLGPLGAAGHTDRLAGGLERALAGEVGGKSANLLPVPHVGKELEGVHPIVSDIREADPGGLVVAELAAFSGQGTSLNPLGPQAVRGGFTQYGTVRVGADPPMPLVELRRDVVAGVAAAAGVPVELFQTAPGDAQREGLRRFLRATLEPVGDLLAEAAGEALDVPDLSLDFRKLHASDTQGRARAAASLSQAGVEVDRALGLAGF